MNPTPTAAMLARPLTLSRPRRCRLAFVPHRTSFCAVRHARPISSFSVGSEPAVSRPPEQESLPPRGLASGQYQAPQMHPYRCIVGSPGTGATPNWGRRNRIDSLPPFMSPGCFEPDRTERPLMVTAKQQAERQQGSSYVHQYSPSTRTERPFHQHMYFSSPSAGHVSAAGRNGVIQTSPASHYKRTALILAGHGSQYIGMAQRLAETFESARKVWIDAEEALARSFDPYARPLGLPEYARSPEQRASFEAALASTSHADPARNGAGTSHGWLRKMVFEGDQLNLTRAENAWPAIFTATMSFVQVLRKEFAVDLVHDHVQAAAGHGLGNLSALVTSDALEFTDGVRFLRHYGLASTLHLSNHPTFQPPGTKAPLSVYDTWGFNNGANAPMEYRRPLMAGVMLKPGKLYSAMLEVELAVADIRDGLVDGVCADEYAEVANVNSSLQLVLGGTDRAVRYVTDRLRQRGWGAKAVNIPTSGPYHTSQMKGAAELVRHAVANLPLSPPHGPSLVSPFTGEPLTNKREIRYDLQGALGHPVHWLESIETMLEKGVERFICLGPGRACAHLLSKELAYRDKTARRLASAGLMPAPQNEYEVWSVASTEDIIQLGGMLQELSLTVSPPPVPPPDADSV